MSINRINSTCQVGRSGIVRIKTSKNIHNQSYNNILPYSKVSFLGIDKPYNNIQASTFLTNSTTRLGANYDPKSTNVDFSVASYNATKVFLCVFDDPNDKKAKLTLPMEQKQEGIWSVSVPVNELGGKNKPIYYGYRAFGPNWDYSDEFFDEKGNIIDPKAGYKAVLDEQGNRFNPNKIAFDPCGRELSHLPSDNPDGIPAFFALNDTFLDNASIAPKSIFMVDKPAIITKTTPRRLIDEVIGEVHVKDLSINEDVDNPGTYKGAGQMVKKIKDSNITMVEFLPVHEFDEKEGLEGNHWGYVTLGYFAPAKKYSSDKSPYGALKEFREMIDTFHKNDIKVCLDVVYNHTGEGAIIDGDEKNAKLMSFALLDNQMYYKQKDGVYNSNTGCGNDMNTGQVEVMEFIADSVAFWANQGVDAFRFDLAAGLLDVEKGSETYYDVQNSVIGKMTELLQKRGIKVKAPDEYGDGISLIAEPWTCSGNYSYQVGNFPQNWAEWNDQFRELARRASTSSFQVSPRDLKKAIEGSNDLMRGANRSINYVYSHDGYNLKDWNNLDRYSNDSSRAENEIKKQIAITLLSCGTPMFQIGDIIGHTKNGNDNSYMNDDETNHLDFSKINDTDSIEYRIYDFYKNMAEFRKKHEFLKDSKQTESNVYYKPDGSLAHNWDGSYWNNPNSNIICYKADKQNPIFVSFSIDPGNFEVKLPPCDEGKNWYKVCDTSQAKSFDCDGQIMTENKFLSKSYSLVIFEQR